MLVIMLAMAAAGSGEVVEVASGVSLIPGQVTAGKGPDGNSIFIEAPNGLILVDTGRHAAHQEKLLAFAKAKGKPIASIVNTHWHLDHSGGNAEIAQAFPEARLYTGTAVEGALKDFFPKSRAGAEQYLASGQASVEQAAEIRHDFAAMDEADALKPDVPVDRSGPMKIAGRTIQVNYAPFAATEGDVWLYDQESGTAIAGDLVVDLVPFMDTACPEGWRKALDQLAATPFKRLVPGHGPVMDKATFQTWRTAFNNLLDCTASSRTKEECVAGWRKDAARFIPAADERRVSGMVGYYIDTRLRAAPEERERYCRPMG
jgi:glyoxylase-like metal-dependent hydrolase (beta-lactamase superfamily II)